MDINKTFTDNFTYVEEKDTVFGHIRYFKCHKCREHVDEFLLYAHLEDHKNPEALFGQEAYDRLKELVPAWKIKELGFDTNYKEFREKSNFRKYKEFRDKEFREK